MIEAPSAALLTGNSRSGSSSPLAKSIHWDEARFTLNDEALAAISIDGRIIDPALDLSSDRPPLQRLNSLNASHWQQKSLDYAAWYKTGQDTQRIKIQFLNSVLKGLSNGRISSFEATDSAYEADKTIAPYVHKSSEGKTGPLSLQGLSFTPPESTAVMADNSARWSGDEELYSDLRALQTIINAAIRGTVHIEAGHIETVNGIQHREGTSSTSYSIARIALQDIHPDSVGRFRADRIEAQYKKARVTFDHITLTDWNLSALPGHLEAILTDGSKAFRKELSVKGAKAAIPAFKAGSLSLKGFKATDTKKIGPDGKPLVVFLANNIELSNFAFDGQDMLQLEAEIDALSLPAKIFDDSGSTTISELMMNKHGLDRLPLNARLHINHSMQQRRLNLQKVIVGMGPLGEVSLNAEINGFSIPTSKNSAALTTLFSKLAQAELKILDNGFIDVILLLPNQHNQSPAALRAEGRQLAEAALLTAPNARAREFMEANVAILANGGLLTLSAHPEKPVTFAEIGAAAKQANLSHLFTLLALSSHYQD
ncbi:hypothetical protein [Aestuariispira insulae]|uniref:hypothetical protein n=1 Tax=Aestuariispira insulae TaxID=1461337 RepID=UPI0011C0837D|nr:hypothetical protein [Aestuariispira insulae]